MDKVADVQQRDRSFVINEAVTQYLSLYEYHCELIEEGIRQDDAGEVVDHETVLIRMEDLIRKSKVRP